MTLRQILSLALRLVRMSASVMLMGVQIALAAVLGVTCGLLIRLFNLPARLIERGVKWSRL